MFNKDTDIGSLKFDNPPRRDATMLPGFGWLSVAFRNDNPGAWLFHCHVAVRLSTYLHSAPASRDMTDIITLVACEPRPERVVSREGE